MRHPILIATALLAGTILGMVACASDETREPDGSGASGASTSTSTTSSTGSSTGGGASTGASTGGGGSGGAGGGTGASGGTGGTAMQSGDCNSDADCPGQACVEVTPGGFRTCTTTPVPSADCNQVCPPDSECFEEFGYCGGIVGPMAQCYADECQQDPDCDGGAICADKGVLERPVNLCMPAGCKLDTDCKEVPGGICAPVDSPCCGIIEGLYCVYPGTGCRHDSDCPGGHCANDGTKSMCMAGQAPCPI